MRIANQLAESFGLRASGNATDATIASQTYSEAPEMIEAVSDISRIENGIRDANTTVVQVKATLKGINDAFAALEKNRRFSWM